MAPDFGEAFARKKKNARKRTPCSQSALVVDAAVAVDPTGVVGEAVEATKEAYETVDEKLGKGRADDLEELHNSITGDE